MGVRLAGKEKLNFRFAEPREEGGLKKK